MAYINEYPGEFKKIEEQLQNGRDLTDEQVAEIMEKFEWKTHESGENSPAV